MQRNPLYIVFAGIVLLFMACEKEVTNIKLPQDTSKLVVNAFISPQDTVLRANVSKTLPAIGKVKLSSNNLTDAIVTISNEEKSVTLMYHEADRYYSANSKDFPILPGKTYFLKVSHPSFPQVGATCTVPVTQNNTLEVAIDSANSRYDGYKEYFMLMKWQDTPSEMNYYRVFAETLAYQDSAYQYYQPLYFDANDLYSDIRLDGANFSSPKAPIWMNLISPGVQTKNTLFAHLLNTDEPYFRYHQSLRNYSNTDGNPFAEPVLIYSNVTGGLGVFAAYNRTTVQIKLN